MPQLYIKTISNRKQPYNYQQDSTIKQLKQNIESRQAISNDQVLNFHQFKLIFQGKQLNQDQKIKDTGIKAGDTIHMTAQLRGG